MGIGTADRSRADETRKRICEAAIAAFADRGFWRTTTRDIAAAAGISPAAVYVHYKTKEELLHQISRAGHREVLDLVTTAIASEPDPPSQLVAVAGAHAAHHARAHARARIVNYELTSLSDEHLQEILELRRAISGKMQDLVLRGIATGDFVTPDPYKAAAALLSLGIDVARWYREGGSWSPVDIGGFYSHIALRVVGAGNNHPAAEVTQMPPTPWQ